MVRLTDQTPPDLRDRLPTPGDDRSALQVGTVHLGWAGFTEPRPCISTA